MSSMKSSYLPSDIIYEIFSKVSYDTLGRCGVVCKEWNQVTCDSKLHSPMSNIVVGFLALHFINQQGCSFTSISDETREISLDFVPGLNFRLEAVSTNYGIVLCKSDDPAQYLVPRFFVCKPRIKLFQQIPNPRIIARTKRVAIYVIRPKPFRYKILRISSSKEKSVKIRQMLNCEVFDSETWTWKRPIDIKLREHHVKFKGWEPVTVGGIFHWLMHDNLVFSFDVEEEDWKIYILPVKEDKHDSIKLVVYEEKLALICRDSEGYLQTWVLENYKKNLWRMKLRINMKDLDDSYYPMAFYGSDIIILKTGLSLWYCNFKNGDVSHEGKLKKDVFPNCLLPFWWNSEPCCGTSESCVQRFEEEEARRMLKQED